MIRNGYTLVELMVTLALSALVLTAGVATYTAFRRSMSLDIQRTNATQNARVLLDRMTRELRQSPEIVTNLSSESAVSTVEFEDGHTGDLTYKRYLVSGTDVQMEVAEYYFASAPTTRVRWNATDQSGNPPTRGVISSQDVAEFVLQFEVLAPQEGLVQVEVTTGELPFVQYAARTTVELRN